jgi:hypothetical protein
MRKFIRHPTCIPIEIAVNESALIGEETVAEEESVPNAADAATMVNISAGGLAFSLLHPVSVGAEMTISMPQVWPDYAARGQVVWCREHSEGFEAGVQFVEADEAFKARMVAQFCQIEDYRRDVREKEGRLLSSEEAAREWIVQYAEEFAETIGWQ